jgi:hypothetical protein
VDVLCYLYMCDYQLFAIGCFWWSVIWILLEVAVNACEGVISFYYKCVKTVGREGNWIMINSYWNICYWFLQHSSCEIRLNKWILLGKLLSSLMTVEMDGMCRIWKVNRKYNWSANQLNQKGIWKGYFPVVNQSMNWLERFQSESIESNLTLIVIRWYNIQSNRSAQGLLAEDSKLILLKPIGLKWNCRTEKK